MKFTGQIRIPEIDHPGVPATFLIEDNQAEVVLEGESLGRWSLFDVQARRLVSSAFQVEFQDEELTFLADDPIDFAYRGVEQMAEVWARYKSMTAARRMVAVKRSRKGTKPSRIHELRQAMLANLEAGRPTGLFSAEETVAETDAVPVTPRRPEPEPPAPGETTGDTIDADPAAAAELSAQQREAERLEGERRAIEEERARLEEERRRLEEERSAAEQNEADRIAAFRLEMERLEQERLEAQRLEQERLAALEEERTRLEAEREERERQAALRAEEAKEEASRLESQRAEVEKLEAERLERERRAEELAAAAEEESAQLEAKRAEMERAEAERLEAARAEMEALEAKRLEVERLASERAEQERADQERLAEVQEEMARMEAGNEESAPGPEPAPGELTPAPEEPAPEPVPAEPAGREEPSDEIVTELIETSGDAEDEETSKQLLVDLGQFAEGEEPDAAAASPEPEPALASASRDKAGIMGAVKSAFTRNSKHHVHDFVEAPGGIGIARSICRECGYVSISSSD